MKPMSDSEVISWLLEAATPSIRYQTLTDLMHLPGDDHRVRRARRDIGRQGPAPAILAKQAKAGHWQGERGYYTPKYTSTHWSMLLLAELGVDGQTPGFRRGAEYMLAATAPGLETRLERQAGGSACFWGNLLRYVLRAGCADDPRLGDVQRYLALDLQEGCRCEINYDTECAWGVARALWGLAALKPQRSQLVRRAIGQGLTFLLESHHLARVDFPVPEKCRVSSLWFKLNFPLFYQADLLFVLRVLGELGGLRQTRAQAALDWLEQRRGVGGTWPGASPYGGRTWRELGGAGETRRWVTLQALRVLQQAGR
jgi:hypothetical protein